MAKTITIPRTPLKDQDDTVGHDCRVFLKFAYDGNFSPGANAFHDNKLCTFDANGGTCYGPFVSPSADATVSWTYSSKSTPTVVVRGHIKVRRNADCSDVDCKDPVQVCGD